MRSELESPSEPALYHPFPSNLVLDDDAPNPWGQQQNRGLVALCSFDVSVDTCINNVNTLDQISDVQHFMQSQFTHSEPLHSYFRLHNSGHTHGFISVTVMTPVTDPSYSSSLRKRKEQTWVEQDEDISKWGTGATATNCSNHFKSPQT